MHAPVYTSAAVEVTDGKADIKQVPLEEAVANALLGGATPLTPWDGALAAETASAEQNTGEPSEKLLPAADLTDM